MTKSQYTIFHFRLNIVSASFFILLMSLSSNRAPFVRLYCLWLSRVFCKHSLKFNLEIPWVYYFRCILCLQNENHWESFSFLFNNRSLFTHYRAMCVLVCVQRWTWTPTIAAMSQYTAKFDWSIPPWYVKRHHGKCWKPPGIQFGNGRLLQTKRMHCTKSCRDTRHMPRSWISNASFFEKFA